jgi:CRP-like cAMP-binding protein
MEQTTLVVLRREDMKYLIGSCPELGMQFIESLIKSLRASESRSADITLNLKEVLFLRASTIQGG